MDVGPVESNGMQPISSQERWSFSVDDDERQECLLRRVLWESHRHSYTAMRGDGGTGVRAEASATVLEDRASIHVRPGSEIRRLRHDRDAGSSVDFHLHGLFLDFCSDCDGGSATCVSDDVNWDVILVTLVGDLVEWPLWLG